jgi:hypothetical protein
MNVQLCRTRRAGVLVASSVHVHVTNNGGSWRLGTILIPTRRFDSGEEEKAGGGKVESDNPAHAQTTAKVGIAYPLVDNPTPS